MVLTARIAAQAETVTLKDGEYVLSGRTIAGENFGVELKNGAYFIDGKKVTGSCFDSAAETVPDGKISCDAISFENGGVYIWSEDGSTGAKYALSNAAMLKIISSDGSSSRVSRGSSISGIYQTGIKKVETITVTVSDGKVSYIEVKGFDFKADSSTYAFYIGYGYSDVSKNADIEYFFSENRKVGYILSDSNDIEPVPGTGYAISGDGEGNVILSEPEKTLEGTISEVSDSFVIMDIGGEEAIAYIDGGTIVYDMSKEGAEDKWSPVDVDDLGEYEGKEVYIILNSAENDEAEALFISIVPQHGAGD